MKAAIVAVALGLAVVLAGTAVSEDDAPPPTSPRVVLLEKKVDVLTSRLAETEKELLRVGKRSDEILGYLRTRAESSQKLLKALTASEKAGFTYGINPRSRELLLEGLRDHLGSAASGLPTGK